MSRQITIHLPEAQCDALAAEAKAAGRSFFDHCRQKLLANMSLLQEVPFTAVDEAPAIREALPQGRWRQPQAATEQPDRIDRLEAMMMQMAATIQNLANPQHIVPAAPAAEASATPADMQADMEAIMRGRLAEAESQGLTAPRAAHSHDVDEVDSDYRMIGVRRFNRPAPPNFSSLGSSGRIQREGTPTSGT